MTWRYLAPSSRATEQQVSRFLARNNWCWATDCVHEQETLRKTHITGFPTPYVHFGWEQGQLSYTSHILAFQAGMNEHYVSLCWLTPMEARKYQDYDLSIIYFFLAKLKLGQPCNGNKIIQIWNNRKDINKPQKACLKLIHLANVLSSQQPMLI